MARIALATDDEGLATELVGILQGLGHELTATVPADAFKNVTAENSDILLYDPTGGDRRVITPESIGLPVIILDGEGPGPYELSKPINAGELEIKLECAQEHAFPDERKGRITVSLKRKGGETCVLSITDDGVGLPDDLDILDTKNLGVQFVKMLCYQLNVKLKLVNHRGAEFRIEFPAKIEGTRS